LDWIKSSYNEKDFFRWLKLDAEAQTWILKKLMPAVAVIIFTAHRNPFVEKEALTSGTSAVISKSDAVAVLIGKARELLDQIAA
jgi:hypothetical protein